MRDAPICGSLFSGAGLLDAGLSLAGWEHAWLCESVPERRELLRTRFPDARVFDDVRTLRGPFAADARSEGRRQVARGSSVDETAHKRGGRVEPNADHEPDRSGEGHVQTAGHVVLIAGGFPCKGVSGAGKQNGFEHAESVLWHEMRRVIGEVRPRYVVVENVRDALSIAAGPGLPAGSLWGVVLADLAALGFDRIRWDVLPAAAVGAPHLRERVFAVASVAAGEDERRDTGQRRVANGRADVAGGGCGPAADSARDGEGGPGAAAGADRQRAGSRVDDAAADSDGARTHAHAAPGGSRPATSERAVGVGVEWGEYGPAIRRWEAVHGTAPEPLICRLDDGRADVQRMRARLDRLRLSALGDGVHVYVGQIVGEYVMSLERARLAAVAA